MQVDGVLIKFWVEQKGAVGELDRAVWQAILLYGESEVLENLLSYRGKTEEDDPALHTPTRSLIRSSKSGNQFLVRQQLVPFKGSISQQLSLLVTPSSTPNTQPLPPSTSPIFYFHTPPLSPNQALLFTSPIPSHLIPSPHLSSPSPHHTFPTSTD
ncbi:hypothetical protein Pcinc_032434 [Petrolisthes cinctipes]|uniref:Uncharacterized protein n=1 Tax=Petrolisthes cinctipes TaxID=88211 RepID=A0AAE1K306_PETCI|nr:hypothetical protein Pcinc_032434 [Petrolisthes cinctipes]